MINSEDIENVSDGLDCFAIVFEDLNMEIENYSEASDIYNSPVVEALTFKLLQLIDPKIHTQIRNFAFKCLTNLMVSF
jgi:hypothetical protein